MSVPPSPISPQVAQMMTAMNTPLPPSPAVASAGNHAWLDPSAAAMSSGVNTGFVQGSHVGPVLGRASWFDP
ncbi:hypothetical protein CBOM_00022 [Ceraceosorus bombacis]|uniref:Uncharacterized protein n=1 Tax=Ceraceosorus bombacis TaxID=401625 RepID=A0A0P1B8J0_9BASI|nr:hypothetical protein CBOM_00022 [Ceraceosorus bombacis]